MSLKNKFKSLFTLDEEYEYDYDYSLSGEEHKERIGDVNTRYSKENVVNLSSIQQPTSKVILCEPRSYHEAQEIADNLVNRRSVVINLEKIDREQAKRIIDFLSGTVYAIHGNIQKLGTKTFLCTPDNVEISGTISDNYSREDF